MKNLPKAKTENLVEQNLGAETLIYDLTTHKAFNLNETSTIVYQACDGKTTFAELKRKHKFTDDFIFLALDELKRNDLLATESVYISPFINTSRREVIKKVGLASMFVLPIISGLIAPKSSQAASNVGDNNFPPGTGTTLLGACFPNGQCLADSQARPLTCINNQCCITATLSGGQGLMPGAPVQSEQTCTSDPGATVTCTELGYNQRCCSNSVSGTCTAESEYPMDSEGGIAPCEIYENGVIVGWTIGYKTTCNCYCD